MTLRPVVVPGKTAPPPVQQGCPCLLTFWHGRMLYFIHLYHRLLCTVLVSQSRDGEFISRILVRFGIVPIRGSSSRGGTRGLLQMVKKVRQGYYAAFTPDGPRGPRYSVRPGVVAVAKKTSAPIVPMTYNAQWKWVLRSWDGFIVPFPFSRVVVVYGEPIYVSPGASKSTLQAKRQEVETSLRRITEIADTYFS